MASDWYITMRFRVNLLCDHDEPGAEALVRRIITEETIAGLAEDNGEILSVEPIKEGE